MVSECVRTGVVVAFLPLKGASYGLSPAQVGALVSVHYLLDGLAKGPMGALSQRLGLGITLLLSALSGLGFLLALPAWPAPALLALSALWGLFYAALWPSVMAASQQDARPGREARALSLVSSSVAPAIAAGALGVGQMMQRAPAQVSGALLAGQLIAAALALSLWRLRLHAAPQSQGSLWRQWRRVAGLLPAAFAQTLAPGLLVALFYPLLRRLNLSLRDLLLPALLGAGILLTALPLAGKVADRQRPRLVLGPGLLLLAAAFGLAGLLTLRTNELGALLYPLAALLGLAYGCFLAGWNGLVGQMLPQQQRAAAWGVVMAVEALGYAAGPLLGSVMWTQYGPKGVFWLGAGVFVLCELYYLRSSFLGVPLGAKSG